MQALLPTPVSDESETCPSEEGTTSLFMLIAGYLKIDFAKWLRHPLRGGADISRSMRYTLALFTVS